ncbi:MAG TPA: phosphate acyltransferase PlsX [Xanthomonadales bacterium]|nr:phosphate acyltransferase PlsX [Xanthomonadales bacterium]
MNEGNSATIAIDAHGGDQGLLVSIPSAIQALREDSRIRLVLCGRQDEISKALGNLDVSVSERLEIAHATSSLAMDAKPSTALRAGNASSMGRAIELLAIGKADACVSSGSTAALMTLSVKQLGLLPGIERPAIMAHVPNGSGFTGMLDLGANLQVSPRQLAQFAIMGAVTAEIADGIDNPRVGLLNVGHEDSKGHDGVREASEMLKTLPLNYIGFIEGHDIFSGKVDVAVCDGFTGNLILKSNEGLARMLVSELRRTLDSSLMSRLGAWLAASALRSMLAQIDPAAHNGAPLLGLNGVVVKSHGGSNVKATTRAILEAGREARRKVPEKIGVSMRMFQMEKEA